MANAVSQVLLFPGTTRADVLADVTHSQLVRNIDSLAREPVQPVQPVQPDYRPTMSESWTQEREREQRINRDYLQHLMGRQVHLEQHLAHTRRWAPTRMDAAPIGLMAGLGAGSVAHMVAPSEGGPSFGVMLVGLIGALLGLQFDLGRRRQEHDRKIEGLEIDRTLVSKEIAAAELLAR